MFSLCKKIFGLILRPVIALNQYPAFKVGNFYLVNFGVFSGVAALVALLAGESLLKYEFPTLSTYQEMGLLIIPLCTILASKLFHCLVVGRKFWANPLHYLSSTAFYNQGGQIGCLIGTAIYAWLLQLNFMLLLDIMCIVSCLALVIGRLGCYNYGCCYGKPCSSIFAVCYEHPQSKTLRQHPELKSVPLYPVQLISALFNLCLFIGLIFVYKFYPISGLTSGVFILSYNIYRSMINNYRADDNEPNTERSPYQITALLFMAFGVIYLISALSLNQIHHPAVQFNWDYLCSFIANDANIVTSILVGTACFVIYGIHYRQLGQHFTLRKNHDAKL